jgi:hypothetical protein
MASAAVATVSIAGGAQAAAPTNPFANRLQLVCTPAHQNKIEGHYEQGERLLSIAPGQSMYRYYWVPTLWQNIPFSRVVQLKVTPLTAGQYVC